VVAVSLVCDEIIKDTNLLFEEKISPKTDKEIEDMFFMLEGKQEEIYPKLASYGITDRIRQSYMSDIDRLNLSAEYDAIFKITKLNTDSLFAKYDDLDDSETVDDKYIELQSRKLIDLYTEIFKNNERMVNRAVMSAVLSELPVFFSDISELQDYIYNALSACTDKAEKIGCVEIINGIMAE
jgi:hypothetical protein